MQPNTRMWPRFSALLWRDCYIVHHPSTHSGALRRKYVLWRLGDKFSRASIRCDAVRVHRSVAKAWRENQTLKNDLRAKASVSVLKKNKQAWLRFYRTKPLFKQLEMFGLLSIYCTQTCMQLCFLDLIKRLTRAKIHKLQHRGLTGQRCGPSAPMFRWARFCSIVPVLFHREKKKNKMDAHSSLPLLLRFVYWFLDLRHEQRLNEWKRP